MNQLTPVRVRPPATVFAALREARGYAAEAADSDDPESAQRAANILALIDAALAQLAPG